MKRLFLPITILLNGAFLYSMDNNEFYLTGLNEAALSIPIYPNSGSRTMQLASNQQQEDLKYRQFITKANAAGHFKEKMFSVNLTCFYNYQDLNTDQEGLEDVALWFKIYDQNKGVVETKELDNDRLFKLVNNISEFYPNNTMPKDLLNDFCSRFDVTTINPDLLNRELQRVLGLLPPFQDPVVSIPKLIIPPKKEETVQPKTWSFQNILYNYKNYFFCGTCAVAVVACIIWKLKIIKG